MQVGISILTNVQFYSWAESQTYNLVICCINRSVYRLWLDLVNVGRI